MAIKITPSYGSLENAELNYSGLYFQQVFSGPDANQAKIVSQDASTGLGETAANNWPIYDGVGQGANLIARAQGLHMYAGSWYNSFVIVFEIARFKDSTLHVLGASINTTSDWAIVGGTGEFELARGVIKREVQGDKQKLTIHAFYVGKNIPKLNRLGPWGGQFGGTIHDIVVKPSRLESITLRTEQHLHSIQFTYLDKDGNMQDSGQWGTTLTGITHPTIFLEPTEVVKEVSGTYINTVVSSLKFVTNIRTYGPYGTVQGDPFIAHVPKDNVVVGFFAVSGTHLDKIGVYTI